MCVFLSVCLSLSLSVSLSLCGVCVLSLFLPPLSPSSSLSLCVHARSPIQAHLYSVGMTVSRGLLND